MIKLLTDMGVKQVALRFSELEGLDTIRNMAGRAQWVWVDCFTKIPIDRESFKELKALGYKLCFVSPNWRGRKKSLRNIKNILGNRALCSMLSARKVIILRIGRNVWYRCRQ